MKQQLIADIKNKFLALGIQAQYGVGTDISISTEFLNAGWSTGKKKINYESNIFLDEQAKIIFMYEKTREEGHGFSFGGESESTFQSGTTLFRKVKSVQYGPDGKAYEITLDLGSIPKAVKETAKQYGWKFKTVLKKNKAMYPAGYVAVDTPPIKEQPQQIQQESEGQAPEPKSNVAFPNDGNRVIDDNNENHLVNKGKNWQGNKMFYWIPFALLVFFTLLFFWLGSNSAVGWILAIVLLVLSYVLKGKILKLGCLTTILFWVITFIMFLIIFTVTLPASNETPGTNNNQSQLKQLDYSKTFAIPNGKGEYSANIKTENNEYKIEIKVTVPNSILPGNFVWNPVGAETIKIDEGLNAKVTDMMDIFLVSTDPSIKPRANGFLGPSVKVGSDGKYVLDSTFSTRIELTLPNDRSLLDLASKYSKIQILKYNVKEVGVRDLQKTKMPDGGIAYNYGYHSEKAYGLHPPIAEFIVAWDQILKDIGLK